MENRHKHIFDEELHMKNRHKHIFDEELHMKNRHKHIFDEELHMKNIDSCLASYLDRLVCQYARSPGDTKARTAPRLASTRWKKGASCYYLRLSHVLSTY